MPLTIRAVAILPHRGGTNYRQHWRQGVALEFEALVINAQQGLALRTAEIHGLASCGSVPMRQVGDNVSDLSCTRHTLAGSDGLSNRRDGARHMSIPTRTVFR